MLEVPLLDERPSTPRRGSTRSSPARPVHSSNATNAPGTDRARLSAPHRARPTALNIGISSSPRIVLSANRRVLFVDIPEVREYTVLLNAAEVRRKCRPTRVYHGTRSRYGCSRDGSPHRRPTTQARHVLHTSEERARNAAVIAALVGTVTRVVQPPLFDVHPRASTPPPTMLAATSSHIHTDPAAELLAAVMATSPTRPATDETPEGLAEQLLLLATHGYE